MICDLFVLEKLRQIIPCLSKEHEEENRDSITNDERVIWHAPSFWPVVWRRSKSP